MTRARAAGADRYLVHVSGGSVPCEPGKIDVACDNLETIPKYESKIECLFSGWVSSWDAFCVSDVVLVLEP